MYSRTNVTASTSAINRCCGSPSSWESQLEIKVRRQTTVTICVRHSYRLSKCICARQCIRYRSVVMQLWRSSLKFACSCSALYLTVCNPFIGNQLFDSCLELHSKRWFLNLSGNGCMIRTSGSRADVIWTVLDAKLGIICRANKHTLQVWTIERFQSTAHCKWAGVTLLPETDFNPKLLVHDLA